MWVGPIANTVFYLLLNILCNELVKLDFKTNSMSQQKKKNKKTNDLKSFGTVLLHCYIFI